jgi:hypothetical protein
MRGLEVAESFFNAAADLYDVVDRMERLARRLVSEVVEPYIDVRR